MEIDGVQWKAASKAGMSEKTARKYLKSGEMPSERKVKPHEWKTREDPFEHVWDELEPFLEGSNGTVQAKTLFDYLQRKYPGQFQEGQLRTLQRRVKRWRALKGPSQEVYFDQVHYPGELIQSDFTHMESLGVSIGGQHLAHMVFHFVLTYSNWESVTLCFSESFESLSAGLQEGLWKLGGVPQVHQTDQLTAAVHQLKECEGKDKSEFNRRYLELVSHYRLQGKKINVAKPNENGDTEQSHYRFKMAVEQELLLRGSSDFRTLSEYQQFLEALVQRRNAGRRERFIEESKKLRPLPRRKLDTTVKKRVRVSRGSTIRVQGNVYSVHSRLIGEQVEVRIKMNKLEVWYGQHRVESFPRLRGKGKFRIDYRHIIDTLVRKAGAFENYVYRSELFPSTNFRVAYDALSARIPSRADKEYLKILKQAAKHSESGVDEALRHLIEEEAIISSEAVAPLLNSQDQISPVLDIDIDGVDLSIYDFLIPSLSSENEPEMRQEAPL